MTHSFRQTQIPSKTIRPRRFPKRHSARSTRLPRRLPEHLSSALLLRRMLLLVGVGILLIGAIAIWYRVKLSLV